MTTPSIELLTDLRRRRVADEATTSELAAEAGMNAAQLKYYWRTRGLVEAMPYEQFTPWTMSEIRALHARWVAGESLDMLAASTLRSRTAIWHAFKRAGLSLPEHDIRGGYGVREDVRRIARRSVVCAAQRRAQGWQWQRIHAHVVQRFGYPFKVGALTAAVRRYVRAHMAETSTVRAAVLGVGDE